MRCVKCKSESLFGDISPHIILPLAKKGGNIITAGYIVTQKMVEEWWLKEDGKERLIIGPIMCADCCEEHTYFKKLVPALRAVPYADALKYGYDHYASASVPGAADPDDEEVA